MLRDRSTIVTQCVRFRAPDLKPRAFVKSLRLGRGEADAQVHPGHSAHRSCVAHSRLQKFGRETAAAMRGLDVHAPNVRLVGGLEVPVAEQANGTDETIFEGAENDRLRRAPQLLTNRLERRGDVVRWRGGERQRRIQQSFASELDIGLGVV